VGPVTTPAEYVLARSVLLDALEALGPNLDAVILVGAQATYLHTGDADLNTPPTTTDADLALAPDKLGDSPLLERAMKDAGFILAADPGAWRGRMGVPIDLMVPEALSGGRSRRAARLPIHGDRVARRTRGLEAAIVDNEPARAHSARSIRRARGSCSRRWPGCAARRQGHQDHPRRQQPKDGLGVLRILQAVPTEELAQRIRRLQDGSLAGDVTRQAVEALRDGNNPNGQIAGLAARAVGVLENPDTIAESVVALVDDLLLRLLENA
jgi:hypothetical protein